MQMAYEDIQIPTLDRPAGIKRKGQARHQEQGPSTAWDPICRQGQQEARQTRHKAGHRGRGRGGEGNRIWGRSRTASKKALQAIVMGQPKQMV